MDNEDPQYRSIVFQDGRGLRGPQTERRVVSAKPHDATFTISEGKRSSDIPGGSIDVAEGDARGDAAGDGVGEVDGVNRITFDQDNFEIVDAGDGEVIVKLKTCPATCPS